MNPVVSQTIKASIVVLAVATSVGGLPRAFAAEDQCSGILHRDRGDLVLGGGRGEDEGICVIGKSGKAKVLAVCAIGRFCRVYGVIGRCVDSGECSQVKRVRRVTRS